MAQASANHWQQVREDSRELQNDVERRQFQEYVQKAKTANADVFRQYGGKTYNLANEQQRLQYQNAQISQLNQQKAQRQDEAIKSSHIAGVVPSEEQAKIDQWFNTETARVNKEITDYEQSRNIEMAQGQQDILKSKVFGYGEEKGNEQIGKYNQILQNMTKNGNYVDSAQRQIVTGIFKTLQKPAIETGKSFGTMNATIRDFNKAIGNGTEISNQQQEAFKANIDSYRTQLKTQLDSASMEKFESTAAALLKENGMTAENLKAFEEAYGEAQGQFERNLIGKGLDKEDVARLTTQGTTEGEAQYDASQKRGLLKVLTPERMDKMWEKAGHVAQTATFALTALQSGANLANTMADKNASTMDKITASLGAGASGLMFGKSMAGLIGGPWGAAAGALSFVATTFGPMIANWIDKQSENEEEKNARLDAWAVSAAEKAQIA